MSNSENPKKKSKLKVALIVIAVIFVLGAIGSMFDDNSKDTDTTANQTTDSGITPTAEVSTPTPVPDSEPTIAPTNTPVPEATDTPIPEPTEIPVTTYESGMYKVGSDIPAGEYIIFADNSLSGYMEISSSSSGNFDDIIANANFSYNVIATLKDGNYLTLTGAYAVPFDEVTELDTTGEGMFKIGVHLKAGEYKLECTNGLSGYYEVASDSTHNFNSIVTNGNFDNNTYITVSKGQYLTITGCKISK